MTSAAQRRHLARRRNRDGNRSQRATAQAKYAVISQPSPWPHRVEFEPLSLQDHFGRADTLRSRSEVLTAVSQKVLRFLGAMPKPKARACFASLAGHGPARLLMASPLAGRWQHMAALRLAMPPDCSSQSLYSRHAAQPHKYSADSQPPNRMPQTEQRAILHDEGTRINAFQATTRSPQGPLRTSRTLGAGKRRTGADGQSALFLIFDGPISSDRTP